ncbi:MAG: autotransporter outer membrane beta-barrel domain-containing protein [Eubacteriales bacterium]
MFKKSVKLFLTISVLLLIFSLYSAAQNAVAPGGTVNDAQSMLDALGGEAAGWLSDTGDVFLRTDISLTAPVTVTGGEIVINGAGCMIKRDFNKGSMFIVEEGTLTFGDAGNTDLDDTLIINGGDETYKQADSALIQNGGTIHFYSGTTIENNDASENNGGAVMINGGTFNLYGGYIRLCSALSGGGIYMSKGTLNMTGGQIKSCTASQNGGGICVTGGVFTMSGGTAGGTVIMDEYASEPAVQSDAGNKALYGGGIFIESGSHTIGGGIVASNNSEYGGGIAVQPDTELVLYSGSIVYNNAASGGGVYNMGTVAQAYTEVAQNKATQGGGVWNGESAEYYIQEGIISSNKSSKDGAGIYNAGIFEMSGGSVNYNESEMSGGGAVNFGTFRLSGGSFGYNKAPYPGRGILGHTGGNVIFSDAVFIGGDNDVALTYHADTNETALLTLEGAFTCTTKVARLTPVLVSDGYILKNYIKGQTLVVTAENNEQDLSYYIPLFDVTGDSTGGVWHLTNQGKLAPEMPGIWFWVTAAAVVLFVAAGVLFVAKARKAKK